MDKRNANDVCSIGKLMEPEMQTEPLATSLSSTAQQKTMKMKSLATPPVGATPHSPTAAASAALLQLETVGNGNHDKFAMRTGKSAGEVPHSISLSLSHSRSLSHSLTACLPFSIHFSFAISAFVFLIGTAHATNTSQATIPAPCVVPSSYSLPPSCTTSFPLSCT